MKPEPLTNLGQIIRTAKDAGSHFFDAETMRFFASRLSEPVYPLGDGSALFITSEKSGFGSTGRAYTVRLAFNNPRHGLTLIEPKPDGKENGFGAFKSLSTARTFASGLKAQGATAKSLLEADDLTTGRKSATYYFPQVEKCPTCAQTCALENGKLNPIQGA